MFQIVNVFKDYFQKNDYDYLIEQVQDWQEVPEYIYIRPLFIMNIQFEKG